MKIEPESVNILVLGNKYNILLVIIAFKEDKFICYVKGLLNV